MARQLYTEKGDAKVDKRLLKKLSPAQKAAFEKECRNFHDFGGVEKLDNDIHPDRPDGAAWKCPVCGQ